MDVILLVLILIIFGTRWIIKTILETLESTHKNLEEDSYSSRSSYDVDHPNNNTLPNGYTRQDYHAQGFSDADIACWGLDQPAAPNPEASGLVVLDMIDGKLDGHIGPLL